jgi:hypothetical protein
MPPGHLPVRSYLAVPVKGVNGAVLGGLFFGHAAAGVFTAKHEQLAMGIAAWAAVALENSRLYDEARNANRMKDDFLAVLSHELRTPLNAIVGYSRLLRGGVLHGEKAERGLETLERNAASLTQIVEDVLDVSRIVSGKIRLDVQPVELPLVVDNAVRDICFTNLACNWLQCQENSLDPVHVEWMHRYFGDWVNSQKYGNFDVSGGIGNVRHHVKIGFDEFEYGIIKRRVLEGYTEEDDDWKHGHPVLFPNILVVGNDYQVTMQFRVPVDDENTLHISVYTWRAAPGKTAPVQRTPPYRFVKIIDEQGEWIRDKVFNQDYMAWETQGPIAKRHMERLGASDMGIIMFRQQLERELQKVEAGKDPMNVFRDPAKNQTLVVPLEHVKFGAAAPPPKYTPGEDGYSRDAELIEAVLDTWRVPELAVSH